MSDPTVYRSRDPEVVQAWIDATDAISGYVQQTQRVLDACGLAGYQAYRHSSGWSPGRFSGLAVPEGEKAPAGWRMLERYAVPDKRTKAGKQVAAALDAVKHPGDPLLKLTGMLPDAQSGRGGFSSPGVRLMENRTAVYVTWSFNPEGRHSFLGGRDAAIDFSRWERVKLSEYYAEAERHEAEREAAA
jgi:hypothetical protein